MLTAHHVNLTLIVISCLSLAATILSILYAYYLLISGASHHPRPASPLSGY